MSVPGNVQPKASVGKLLRKARKSQELEVADIAAELCISQRYLLAIEVDDFSSLPGAFFYKSFVRQYGARLGVDGQTLKSAVEAFMLPAVPSNESSPSLVASARAEQAVSPPPRESDPIIDPILQETNHPRFSGISLKWSGAALTVILVGCSGFYQWWSRIPEIPLTVATVVLAAPPVLEAPPVPVTPLVETQPAVQTHAVETKPPDLTLSATELTWLSVTSDGRQIFSGVLQPSESKTLSGVRTATVKIGNAGGVEIHWKGAALGPLGGRGEVRTVLLTPENFKILDPAKQL